MTTIITTIPSLQSRRFRRRSLAASVVLILAAAAVSSLCRLFTTTRLYCNSCIEEEALKFYTSFRQVPITVQFTKRGIRDVKVLLLPSLQQEDDVLRDNVRDNHTHGSTDTYHHQDEQPSVHNDNNCVAMAAWQEAHHPSCSLFHELDLLEFEYPHKEEERLKIVGSGFYRLVWMVRSPFNGETFALKTLRFLNEREEQRQSKTLQQESYAVDFIPPTMEQQRIDAVVMDELSFSNYISDIYGYCSTSALTEFSSGGNLATTLENANSQQRVTKQSLLEMAHTVAQAVADLHHPHEGLATIAHTDLNPNQFLLMGNGHYKLNDFNRAILVRRNNTFQNACPIQSGINWRATYQSPEELSGKRQTEKVDVFTMGLVLYNIWTKSGRKSLYPHKSPSQRRDFVAKGGTPKLPTIEDSEHPLDLIMPLVLQKCWITLPDKRASAQEIADMLRKALEEL